MSINPTNTPPKTAHFLTADFFALFGLERVFSLDLQVLNQAYLSLQKKHHPDQFANANEQQKREAAQLAAHINDAYQQLKAPSLRARYLLQLAHIDVNKIAAPIAVLEEQIKAREALEQALEQAIETGNEEAFQQQENDTQNRLKETIQELSALFLQTPINHTKCAEKTHELVYFEKLLTEIEEAQFPKDD